MGINNRQNAKNYCLVEPIGKIKDKSLCETSFSPVLLMEHENMNLYICLNLKSRQRKTVATNPRYSIKQINSASVDRVRGPSLMKYRPYFYHCNNLGEV